MRFRYPSAITCLVFNMGCTVYKERDSGEAAPVDCPIFAYADGVEVDAPVPGWPGSLTDMLAALSGPLTCTWRDSSLEPEVISVAIEYYDGNVSWGGFSDCSEGLSFRANYEIGGSRVLANFHTGGSLYQETDGSFGFRSTANDLVAEQYSFDASLTGGRSIEAVWQQLEFTGESDIEHGDWTFWFDGVDSDGERLVLFADCET